MHNVYYHSTTIYIRTVQNIIVSMVSDDELILISVMPLHSLI